MTVKELIESYVGYEINNGNIMIDLDGNECPSGLILSDMRFASKKVAKWGFTYDHMLGISTAD